MRLQEVELQEKGERKAKREAEAQRKAQKAAAAAAAPASAAGAEAAAKEAASKEATPVEGAPEPAAAAKGGDALRPVTPLDEEEEEVEPSWELPEELRDAQCPSNRKDLLQFRQAQQAARRALEKDKEKWQRGAAEREKAREAARKARVLLEKARVKEKQDAEEALMQKRAAYERELSSLAVRAKPLGQDRHYRRYWWGLGGQRGCLFVEDADAKLLGAWHTTAEIDGLIKALDGKGVREHGLLAELNKAREAIALAMQPGSTPTTSTAGAEDDGKRYSQRERAQVVMYSPGRAGQQPAARAATGATSKAKKPEARQHPSASIVPATAPVAEAEVTLHKAVQNLLQLCMQEQEAAPVAGGLEGQAAHAAGSSLKLLHTLAAKAQLPAPEGDSSWQACSDAVKTACDMLTHHESSPVTSHAAVAGAEAAGSRQAEARKLLVQQLLALEAVLSAASDAGTASQAQATVLASVNWEIWSSHAVCISFAAAVCPCKPAPYRGYDNTGMEHGLQLTCREPNIRLQCRAEEAEAEGDDGAPAEEAEREGDSSDRSSGDDAGSDSSRGQVKLWRVEEERAAWHREASQVGSDQLPSCGRRSVSEHPEIRHDLSSSNCSWLPELVSRHKIKPLLEHLAQEQQLLEAEQAEQVGTIAISDPHLSTTVVSAAARDKQAAAAAKKAAADARKVAAAEAKQAAEAKKAAAKAAAAKEADRKAAETAAAKKAAAAEAKQAAASKGKKPAKKAEAAESTQKAAAGSRKKAEPAEVAEQPKKASTGKRKGKEAAAPVSKRTRSAL
ncbi:hypothetical protein MMC07_000425 [Pseudocyphellaria aurata]|nr:hypothetical protein [Pseudocyphellaria aurata]